MADGNAHEPADDRTYEAPALTSLGTDVELGRGNEGTVTDGTDT